MCLCDSHIPSGETLTIYDAAVRYVSVNTPLVILAGKVYGTGSSRDWAAKGTRLLGVKAVIAESFERIHRSNLIGMGVLPLEFQDEETRQSLGLVGDEIIDIDLPEAGSDIVPRQTLVLTIKRADGSQVKTNVRSRLDTDNEIEYFKSGGILQYVLNNPVDAA